MHTKTTCLDRGMPAYLAPEIFLSEKRVNVERTSEDLKRIDIWAYGMGLFSICNPQSAFPYQEDVKNCQNKIAGFESLLKGKRPTHGEKYSRYVLNIDAWQPLQRVHEACTCFHSKQRPSSADILKMLLEKEDEVPSNEQVQALEVEELNQPEDETAVSADLIAESFTNHTATSAISHSVEGDEETARVRNDQDAKDNQERSPLANK